MPISLVWIMVRFSCEKSPSHMVERQTISGWVSDYIKMKLSRAFSVSIIPSLTIYRKSLQTSILRLLFGVVRNCKHTCKFSFKKLMDFMSSLAQSLRKFVKFLITATLVSSPMLFWVIFLLIILNISLSPISFSGYFNQTCDMASKPTSKYSGFWSFFLRIS